VKQRSKIDVADKSPLQDLDAERDGRTKMLRREMMIVAYRLGRRKPRAESGTSRHAHISEWKLMWSEG
jgi:hypothetical protein